MRDLRLGAVASALLVCSTLPGRADTTGPTTISGSFDVELMHPAPGAYSLVVAERPRVMPLFDFSLGMATGFAFRPLKACSTKSCTDGRSFGGIVQQRATAWFLAALSLKYAELGLAVPFSLINESEIPPGAKDQPLSGGPGDIRVSLKQSFLGKRAVGLGIMAAAALPTGNPGNFLGGPGYAVEGWGLADLAVGPVVVAASGGYRWRSKDGVTQNITVRNAIVFAGGLALELFRGRMALLGDAHGAVAVGASAETTPDRPLEVTGAIRYRPRPQWSIIAGGGKGVRAGLGAPDWRAFGSLVYQHTDLDRDDDGVPDAIDACRDVAEDKDGFEDSDGCPDLDNDKDGVPDAADECPDRAEDKDGFEDNDGCADLDNDKDGVPDAADKCPDQPEDVDGFDDADGCPDLDDDHDGVVEGDKCATEPEDIDGFEDTDGCPDLDNDKDGIPDAADKCPNEAEDLDQVDDEDGCPDDNDKDGFPDAKDKCPNAPETVNGNKDDDGCPDSGKSYVDLVGDRIELKDSLAFERKSATLKEKSFEALDQIAAILQIHPDIKLLRVVARADDNGTDELNLQISQQRAEAVVQYFVLAGIAPDRLEAKGLGNAAEPEPPADGKKRHHSSRHHGGGKKTGIELIIVQRAATP